MLTKDPTSELHNENKAWERDLAHWKEELYKLDKQLATISESWTDDVEQAELQKFKNRFDNHIEASKELMLAIEDHEDQLKDDSRKDYFHLGEIAQAVHSNLKARTQELQKAYRNIKNEYFEYLNNNF